MISRISAMIAAIAVAATLAVSPMVARAQDQKPAEQTAAPA